MEITITINGKPVQATVGEALGMHRITVRRYQDRYVINLALLAVQEGLARMEEKADGTA